MSSSNTRHPRKGYKGKGAKNTSTWTQWQWDERGWYYRSRTGPSGQLENQYDHPANQQATPPIIGEPPIVETPFPKWDNYTPRQVPATSKYTATYPTPVAQTPYSTSNPYSSVDGVSSINSVTDQLASTYITAEYGTPLENNPQRVESAFPGKLRRSASPINSDLSGYQSIKDGSRFFKVGRVFRCMWSEPAGSNARGYLYATPSSKGEGIYSKTRYFVVVQEQRDCCTCLPIGTYGRQGTKKRGITPGDYAAVYDSAMGKAPPTPGEAMTKESFPIIAEGQSTDPLSRIDLMSRIDFGRIYTVEHNVKVVKVGRIQPHHIPRLKRYFRQTFLGETEAPAESSQQSPSANTFSSSYLPTSVLAEASGYDAESSTTNPIWYGGPIWYGANPQTTTSSLSFGRLGGRTRRARTAIVVSNPKFTPRPHFNRGPKQQTKLSTALLHPFSKMTTTGMVVRTQMMKKFTPRPHFNRGPKQQTKLSTALLHPFSKMTTTGMVVRTQMMKKFTPRPHFNRGPKQQTKLSTALLPLLPKMTTTGMVVRTQMMKKTSTLED
ncbi:hypothetical protein D0Z07_4409 [Hyphodiscus hymeniophilus]|uniref:DUF6590 domain-containing protein n=1 Tax=Hyphodiscus hymeniophilus TaxID=353542 RepID=A0A9P7AX93_9HELO|nr:hypothetical protein D0Z07_4409 [Hyphodiscus hymeniophilus]